MKLLFKSYIASKDVIHRDLAARNVLLTNSRVAKVTLHDFFCRKIRIQIADFGLAIRSNQPIDVMQRGLIPIKWTAIEALKENAFSIKSDVYNKG